ncbi:MAG TPA: SMP-30/gluconolactonase/LRE family protein [Terriglobales bacterium]|jgi:DNA-binding beta-propeller fold protein YncE|nr:SMP-30/gluconolactonase/LRE family protein [Terriglobales bacterium]
MTAITKYFHRKWIALDCALIVAAILLALLFPNAAFGGNPGKKKKDSTEAAQPAAAPASQKQDTSKLVWPTPPNVPRVRYTNYFAGMPLDYTPTSEQPKKKSSWMDRLAGVQDPNNKQHFKPVPFQLLAPYGMAVNSKGNLYVADQRVGAIFVFNTETKETSIIGNGHEATFGLINGLAIDDDDRLFVTDGKMRRVLIFDKNNKVVDQIKDGLIDPVGLAIDTENRQLYVVDTQADQVVVYDADTLKEKRRIGTGGKHHELTTPGDFSLPTFVALDSDGNVYVTDTMNFRVEMFDADGHFILQIGKHCDGPGCFSHPKGIAVDSDGHIWVADPMLDILQAFNRDGQLMGIVGGHGKLLGQFSELGGVYIDKNNRIFTSEQYPGRVQMFRYITDAEADQLKKEKEAQRGGAKASVEKPAAAEQQAAANVPAAPKPEAAK